MSREHRIYFFTSGILQLMVFGRVLHGQKANYNPNEPKSPIKSSLNIQTHTAQCSPQVYNIHNFPDFLKKNMPLLMIEILQLDSFFRS